MGLYGGLALKRVIFLYFYLYASISEFLAYKKTNEFSYKWAYGGDARESVLVP